MSQTRGMAPPLLLLSDITVTLGTAKLLAGATLSIGAGERICLVGRNGSGKSTLLKIAAGQAGFDSGTRFLQPGATLRYLPQEPDLSGYATVLDYVRAGLGPHEDEHRARYLLGGLGLSGEERPAHLSGGEARRAALARTLAPAPDLLLLDEPTNHLDLPGIEWLEEELKSLSCGLVLVSHDRRFLERLSRAMVWLDRGQTRRLEKGFAYFEAWRDEVLEQEEREFHKLGRRIAREEDWLRYGVTARRKRNVKRLADLQGLRAERRNFTHRLGTAKLAALDAATSGRIVVDAEAVSKSFGGRAVVRGLTLRVLRGDRLAIAGPNGAGKTTLLKLLLGQEPPDSGSVRLGTALEVVTLDQQRAALDPARTLSETLTGGTGDQVIVGGQARHVIGYMKDFLFKPEQALTPVGTLSGGERGRLLLAMALTRPSNLLVLDEPTNDLDLETLDLLQEMLSEYPGTVVFVSHDRDFIDRVATSVLMAEGEGRWVEYAGGYSDMLAQRGGAETVRAAARTERKPAAAAPRPAVTASPRGGLSFKEQHELKRLEEEMERLRQEMAAASARLAAPGFYERDPPGFAAATAALGVLQSRLEAAEERWLELELRKAG